MLSLTLLCNEQLGVMVLGAVMYFTGELSCTAADEEYDTDKVLQSVAILGFIFIAVRHVR